jgi:hypothetical protein
LALVISTPSVTIEVRVAVFTYSEILDLVLRRLVLEMDCRYFRDVLAPVPFWAVEASELEVA